MIPFEKSDSFTILESSRRKERVLVMLESDGDDAYDGARAHKVSPTPPLALSVELRLCRLLLLTAAVSLSTMALVVACRHGIQLTTFSATSKTESERSKLLDDYNSYSGTVAAMVGRPLEVFVALLAQIVMVRCAADTMVRDSNPSRSVWIVTLSFGAGVGYLLNNVLNALNVQLRSMEVRPVIVGDDLSVVGSVDALVGSAIANNRTNTVSDAIPQNPLSNSVLRNLVMSREAKSPLNCPWTKDAQVTPIVVQDDLLEYGLPQRDWQSRFLTEALTPQRLRLIVNATSSSENTGVPRDELPMPVARAANLFMNGLLLMNSYLPIDSSASYFTRSYPNVTIPLERSSTYASPVGSAAIFAGALPPPSLSADETTQRAWFVNQSQVLLSRVLKRAWPIRENDVGLEFSHVQITSSIMFDAVTFDLEMDPAIFGQPSPATNNRTRETTIDRGSQCGPWPALCVLPKQKFSIDNALYDPQMQVQAFSVCTDEAGDETLRVSAVYSDGEMYPPTSVYADCDHTSNSSLLVVSVAKRLTADSLVLRQPEGSNATATNLRKFYSLTVGRLGWELANLSTEFNATCGTLDGRCLGLHVELSDATANASQAAPAKQQLIVSSDALPLAYVSEPNYQYAYASGNGKQRSLPLVRIHEPPPSRDKDTDRYDIIAGDILFPHNVRDIQWNQTALWTKCNAVIEDRLQLVVKNHMYMEQSLQPAYTAATFFLLQNGVVKDTIALDATRTSLQFQGNQQDVAVWVSVPALNAWLTLAGCIIVALCAFVTIAWPAVLERKSKPDALRGITTPHAIARVLLDEKQFPPLLLERRVVDGDRFVDDRELVELLRVESIALRQRSIVSQV